LGFVLPGTLRDPLRLSPCLSVIRKNRERSSIGRSIQRWGAQVNFTDRYTEIPIREHHDEVRALLAATQ
jgi:hypothetical protein